MYDELTFGKIGLHEIPVLRLSDWVHEMEIIPLGAAIRSLRVPDRNGDPVDICLGYDDPESYYRLDGCMGGSVGRCANRIGGAKFTLDGQTYKLTANDGPNTLHGGADGFHRRLWRYAPRPKQNSVIFVLDSPDGDEGFPGALRAEVCYTLYDATLTIEYRAVCDRDTVVNLTNHAYFNLAGQDQGPVDDHILTVNASQYTPTKKNLLPTGRIAPVDDTPLDLRGGVALGTAGELDHNFVLGGDLEQPAAELYCPRTGIDMKLYTDAPGLQVYTAGQLTPRTGKSGAAYGPRHAVCLEPQTFPDAVHHPKFPTAILKAGERYSRTIRLVFSTR